MWTGLGVDKGALWKVLQAVARSFNCQWKIGKDQKLVFDGSMGGQFRDKEGRPTRRSELNSRCVAIRDLELKEEKHLDRGKCEKYLGHRFNRLCDLM